MLIEPLQYSELYGHIRKQSANRGTSILILVSNDSVDSLCALRILVNVLVTDQLQHSVRSVSNYDDIKDVYKESVKDSTEIRSVILLNCGITTSLIELLELYDPQTEQIVDVPYQFYIIDHHRPMDLENLWDQRDDPSRGSLFSLINILIYDQNETMGVNSDGSERYPTPDEPTEDDLDGEDVRRDIDGDDLLEYDEDGNPVRRARRGWDADRFIALQDRRKKWTEQLTIHYDGSYFSIASSLIMAEMVDTLGKNDNNTVWLAIVGVTDMYINQQMNALIYNTLVDDLRAKVRDQNNENDDRLDMDSEQQRHGIKSGQIIESTELKLYLLRHWSVFESMSYTPYICSHIGIWRSEGQETIQSILATMGLPLEQAKRLYHTMEPTMRHELIHTIPNTCSKPRYGLTDMTYQSFIKQYGNGFKLSAADAVYALQAILESVDETRVYNRNAVEDGHQWEKNFSVAFDTLASTGQQHNLKQGIEMAKKMQKAIINEGNAMLIRKPFNYRDVIRSGVVESSSAAIEILTQPLALRRLAEYVRDSIGGPIIKKNIQPTMIAAAPPKHTSNTDQPTATDGKQFKFTHTVAGVQAVPVGLVKSKNRFGNIYRDANAKEIARIKHDTFDASVVEVQSDDIDKFLEYVSLVTANDFEPDGELTG